MDSKPDAMDTADKLGGIPRTRRSHSLGALLISNQQRQRLFANIAEELDTVPSGGFSQSGSAEDLSQISSDGSGSSPGTEPGAGLTGGMLSSRRQSLFTISDEPIPKPAEPKDPIARRASESALWKWFTTPTETPTAGGRVESRSAAAPPSATSGAPTTGQSAVGAPTLSGVGSKLNLLKKISSRDINAISPSDW